MRVRRQCQKELQIHRPPTKIHFSNSFLIIGEGYLVEVSIIYLQSSPLQIHL